MPEARASSWMSPATPQTSVRVFLEEVYLRRPSISSPGTKASYRAAVSNLEHAWRGLSNGPATVTLADLSPELIYAAMAQPVRRGVLRTYERSRAASGANTQRGHLLCVWRHAADQGLAPPPPRKIGKAREPQFEPRAHSFEEVEALFDLAGRLTGRVGDVSAALFWSWLVRLVYNTAERISALVHAPTANCDLTAATPRLRVPFHTTKGKKDRSVALFDSTAEAGRRLRLRDRRIATVFGDWPKTKNTLREHFRVRLLEPLGLWLPPTDADKRRPRGKEETDVFHRLRKTAATVYAAENGVVATQAWLQHSSIEVTKRYIDQDLLRKLTGGKNERELLREPQARPRGALAGCDVQLRLMLPEEVA